MSHGIIWGIIPAFTWSAQCKLQNLILESVPHKQDLNAGPHEIKTGVLDF
jgi:hypothetical protein